MATCWQMADDLPELASPELPAEFQLAAAVIRKAISDLRGVDVGLKRDAHLFFSDFRGDFTMWCEIVGLSPALILHLVGFPVAEPEVCAVAEGPDSTAPGEQLDLFPGAGKI
jgi:hypothetical protein